MAALAAALPEEALPACKKLILSWNQIGDAGCEALAAAFSKGALRACEKLNLDGNKIGDAGFKALAAALNAGALPACKVWRAPNPHRMRASARGRRADGARVLRRAAGDLAPRQQ